MLVTEPSNIILHCYQTKDCIWYPLIKHYVKAIKRRLHIQQEVLRQSEDVAEIVYDEMYNTKEL